MQLRLMRQLRKDALRKIIVSASEVMFHKCVHRSFEKLYRNVYDARFIHNIIES